MTAARRLRILGVQTFGITRRGTTSDSRDINGGATCTGNGRYGVRRTTILGTRPYPFHELAPAEGDTRGTDR
ncbi:MAG: hypothetical protein Kow0010_07030 [Dehalococcoidia bacterium]